MSDVVKRYQTRPEPIEAALVDRSNIEQIALWCGGLVYGTVDDSKSETNLHMLVPALPVPIEAYLGNYVVLDRSNGKFRVMKAAEFEARYQPVATIQFHNSPAIKSPPFGGSIERFLPPYDR